MIDLSSIDYTRLDSPAILKKIFFPRKESEGLVISDHARVFTIPVGDEIMVGARLYPADTSAPTLLFFHGNGEIVADYDFLGMAVSREGLNFLPVDYRGYGISGGVPTVTGMLRDAHVILDYVRKYLAAGEYTGPLVVMGRSLGSASAIELAGAYPDAFGGLIIESGIAYALPLFRILGINTYRSALTEQLAFNNVEKIGRFNGPVLIIHAERDQIVPLTDGMVLYEACPSRDKIFLEIQGANHNTIHQQCLGDYLDTVQKFTSIMKKKH